MNKTDANIVEISSFNDEQKQDRAYTGIEKKAFFFKKK